MDNKHFNRLALHVTIFLLILHVIDVNAQSNRTNVQQTRTKNSTDKQNSTRFSENEVTLIVSGDGSTKDEATKVALRSAIEQAFGTFVSSNTQILNDELVKDEIVTVSSGNIKSYKYISESENAGKYYVTLDATVSIGKLISYAKSKGSKAEFAGQTFAMNVKLMELREQNTIAAYNNLCLQAGELINNAFDYNIELEDPVIAQSRRKEDSDDIKDGYSIKATIKVLATPVSSQIYSLFQNTLNRLNLSESERIEYTKAGMILYNYTRDCAYELPRYKGKERNDIVLPVSPIQLTLLDHNYNILIPKIYVAIFSYKLIDISNPDYYLVWQKSLKRGDKVICLAIKDNGLPSFSLYTPSGDLWLVDSNRETFYAENLKKFYFSGRLDLDSSWPKWLLPNTTKKKGKNIEIKFAEVKQVIYQNSFHIFIPKDKMSNFRGFSIEKNTNPFTLK